MKEKKTGMPVSTDVACTTALDFNAMATLAPKGSTRCLYTRNVPVHTYTRTSTHLYFRRRWVSSWVEIPILVPIYDSYFHRRL